MRRGDEASVGVALIAIRHCYCNFLHRDYEILEKGTRPCHTRSESFIDSTTSSFLHCGVWSGGCKFEVV
jgi:hypothetical protein